MAQIRSRFTQTWPSITVVQGVSDSFDANPDDFCDFRRSRHEIDHANRFKDRVFVQSSTVAGRT